MKTRYPNNSSPGQTHQTDKATKYKAPGRQSTGSGIQQPKVSLKFVRLPRILLPAFFILISLTAFSLGRDMALNGYVKYLGMYYHPKVQIPEISEGYLASGLIHNRLNFRWYASSELTLAIETRNRLIFGQMIREFPDYQSLIDVDNGYFDLSGTIASGNSWFLYSIIDRAWLDYEKGKWQVRVGRQRINWGINLVWNPNDVFNSFSYFDFDYEERPGTDAVKVQYFTGVTSSAELVYKFGANSEQMALAGMYRFSKWSYDFQFLGGWVGKDYIFGGGWSGDIKGAGFRGEATYFKPRNGQNGSNEALVASVSADYTFSNSLYIHSGVLYNSHGVLGKAGGRSFFDQNLSAKMLSLARYSLFGQVSYPFTPLFSGDFMAIVNPSDHSYFLGPSLIYSLGNNLEVMLTGQLFFGEKETEYGDYGQAVFGRLKWSF
ncbi:MAG: hypothetical protein GXO81_09825 [Chlorobi bacterium]|nr:hypothetical protein [Chlorobiota bacterium]